MKKYEVILFDLDDTLINNLENVRYAYKMMVEFVGDNYTEIGFKKWYDFDKKYWVERTNGNIIIPKEYMESKEKMTEYVRSLRHYLFFEGKITLEKAYEINKIYIESLNERVIPIEGAYQTLKYLYDKYKLVIVTNGPSLAVKSKLGKINCLNLIDTIFSSDMTKQRVSKPNKEYFEELLEYMNYYDKDKMLIVGDSLYSDILGGMNIGIDTCWFNPDNENLPPEYQPTLVISKLNQLTKIL